MIKFKLNGKEIEAGEGSTILQAAWQYGVNIPAVCAHKDLSSYGSCRICLVEITGGGRPGVTASCQYKVTEGLEVKTDTERVEKARKIMFELLLARAPDAPKLKALAAEYGVTSTRIKRIGTEDCILCGLCVRACDEVSQRHSISFSGRGPRRRIQTAYDRVSQTCIGCGACAYVCPTECITVEQAD